MIYDCFLFFNENDLLEVRLNQHNKFVDKFIIVEAAETHTGIKKDLCFDHKRFERFSDKIIYRSIHSFEDEIKKNPNLISQNISNFITPQKQLNHQDWIRDNFQAEYITKTLLEQNPNQEDIVLFSCLDEILNEEAFIECLSVFSTNQKFFLKSKIFNKYVLEKKVDPVFSFVLEICVSIFVLSAIIICPIWLVLLSIVFNCCVSLETETVYSNPLLSNFRLFGFCSAIFVCFYN